MIKTKRRNTYITFICIAILIAVCVTLASAYSVRKTVDLDLYRVEFDLQSDIPNLTDIVIGDTIINSASVSRNADSGAMYVRGRLSYDKTGVKSQDDIKYLLALNYGKLETYTPVDNSYKWTWYDDGYYYLTDGSGNPLVIGTSDNNAYIFCENVVFEGAKSLMDDSIATPTDLELTIEMQGLHTKNLSSATITTLSSAYQEAYGTQSTMGYIVTFESNGEYVAPAQVFYREGMTVTEPTVDGIGGTFTGWYSDKDCTIEYNFEDVVTKNMTLYTGWSETPASITINDGSNQLIQNVELSNASLSNVISQYTTLQNKYNFYSDMDFKHSISLDTVLKDGDIIYAQAVTPNIVYTKITGLEAYRAGNNTNTSSNAYSGSATNLIIADNYTVDNVTYPVTEVGQYAFHNNTTLTSITIPASINRIANGAFGNCTSVTSLYFNPVNCYDFNNPTVAFAGLGSEGSGVILTIGADVERIPGYIFNNTPKPNITTVYFESDTTLKSIGYYAFIGCTSIVTMDLPSSVETVEMSAFSGCSNWVWDADISNMQSINIYAFQNCSKLTGSLVVNSHLNTIANSAFNGCSGISGVDLGNVSRIGTSAFEGAGITSLYIPASVSALDNSAFNGCGKLNSIIVDPVNTVYTSRVNDIEYNIIIEKSSNTLIRGCNNSVIPEGVVSINTYAFEGCSGLTNITIPNSVESIGGSAFYGCSALTSVTIGLGVTSIGGGAFYECIALTSIEFNATNCANLSSTVHAFDYAGTGEDNMGIVLTIGANVTKIPAYLFNPFRSNQAPNIKSVEFKAGSLCKNIGTYAFAYCSSLQSITIPESVESIGNYAFRDCTGLTSIAFNATNCADLSSGNRVFSNAGENSSGVTVTIGSNVTKIPAYMFRPYTPSDSPNITSVTFETGSVCTSIGNYAFADISSLASITISDSLKSIGNYAFYKITELISVTMGSGVTNIGTYAFAYCSNLKSITIPESVESIGNDAFYNCTGLTSIEYNATNCADLSSGNYVFYNAGENSSGITVTIGSNVTKIPAYLFNPYSSYSPNITSVTFEDESSCTSIGDYAFARCDTLASITIPSSVTSIGYRAFYDCNNLTSATFVTTTGWYVTTTEGATSGTTLTLTDTSNNATYLKTTHVNKYWYRK